MVIAYSLLSYMETGVLSFIIIRTQWIFLMLFYMSIRTTVVFKKVRESTSSCYQESTWIQRKVCRHPNRPLWRHRRLPVDSRRKYSSTYRSSVQFFVPAEGDFTLVTIVIDLPTELMGFYFYRVCETKTMVSFIGLARKVKAAFLMMLRLVT